MPQPAELKTIEGATVHYSRVSDWASYAGAGRAVIVGGGEAGFDAALYLLSKMEAGEVVVVHRGGEGGKEGRVDDPSLTLAPVTRARLDSALSSFGGEGSRKKLTILKGCECTGIGEYGGVFEVVVEDTLGNVTKWRSPLPVVLATGFSLGFSSNCVLQGLSDWDDTGRPILSPDCDEVQKTTGVFVVGPMVKHTVDVASASDDEGGEPAGSCAKIGVTKSEEREMMQPEDVILCFIYKFRCR